MSVATTSSNSKPFIDRIELAEMFGVTTYTLDVWRRQGLLPAPIRMGKRLVRWRRSYLERFFDKLQAEAVRNPHRRKVVVHAR